MSGPKTPLSSEPPSTSLMESLPFPQELCEEIIDRLQGSQSTLKACILVCRAWLPRARIHLFHNMTFPPKSHDTHTGTRPKRTDDQLEIALHHLVKDMKASSLSSSWASCVRNLTIDGMIWTPALTSLIPKGILENLPFHCLESITIKRFYNLVLLRREYFHDLFQQNAGLKSLSLDQNDFNATYFFQIMSVPASLNAGMQTVSLRNVGLSSPHWQVDRLDRLLNGLLLPLGQPKPLHTLELTSILPSDIKLIGQAFFNHPRSLFRIGSLRTVILTLTSINHNLLDFECILSHQRCQITCVKLTIFSDCLIGDILPLCHLSTLTDLELTFAGYQINSSQVSGFVEPSTFFQAGQLDTCSNLRSLSIRFVTGLGNKSTGSISAHNLALSASMLIFTYQEERWLQRLNKVLLRIDRALAALSPRIPGVGSVGISVSQRFSDEINVNWILQRFLTTLEVRDLDVGVIEVEEYGMYSL
ncbi:hypothetical protein VKT23_016071 [Stygiomarasmius scandens]|uniref:F-box domain-containing protein n=1 Tax=Marasmiellus scandens TaxID=2682957 RepID=A0ABR1IYT2_9AGAR